MSFRFIGHHSIDFHIISSLWIDKVGVHLEKYLSEKSYGSRLKRPNQQFNKFVVNKNNSETSNFKNINGHFRPYYWDYRRWQDDGIKSIEEALKKDKNVVVMTADITKFYHSVSADFLLDQKFYSFLTDTESPPEIHPLTHLMVDLLNQWSHSNVDSISNSVLKNKNHCGLPVGLSASKVIANLFLEYFDRKIEAEVNPIHYGRYVDDIFLVLENKNNLKSSEDVWNYIGARVKECSFSGEFEDNPCAKFKAVFGKEDIVEFGSKKEKLFVLESESGDTFIETLKESMNENSSEWRLLPDSDEEIENLSKQIASSSSTIEEHVNSLRKSDGLSIQRLKFALRLRNFESLVDLVPKAVWNKGIKKFLSISKNFIISPQQFATYLRYYPRIIGLAVKANEFESAKDLIERFKECWNLLSSKNHNLYDSDFHQLLFHAWEFSNDLIFEAIAANTNFYESKEFKEHEISYYGLEVSYPELNLIARKLFFSDLHSISFKNIFFRKHLYKSINLRRDGALHKLNTIAEYTEMIDRNKIHDFLHAVSNFNKFDEYLPNALYFYTRSFNTLEITSLLQDWCVSEENLKIFNTYLNLFAIPKIKISIDEHSKSLRKLKITSGSKSVNPVVALTSLHTSEKSWVARVREDGLEPDNTRFTRIFRMINDILKCKKDIEYVVFPELSMPRQLVMYIANKLKAKRISLIAGIEYSMEDKNITENINGMVSNQLLYVLNTYNGSYYEQVYIVQDKVIPAFHEERELFDTGGKIMKAKSELKYILQHGKFFFSGLICNELLNLDYRQPLRGEIDTLFVIEWNKDIDMYDPIISSTSNDLHCFMVQVNNREYGDTRLRGPYKESYERDKVRVRGGELDYFIVATIDIMALREFQRYHRSPSKPFKPTPTGFKISDERRFIDLF